VGCVASDTVVVLGLRGSVRFCKQFYFKIFAVSGQKLPLSALFLLCDNGWRLRTIEVLGFGKRHQIG